MSCLRLTGRLIALFIIFMLVTITPSLILAYNAQQAVVEGDFLDELFEEPDLFEAIIPEMAEELARDTQHEFENESLARLDADEWERIIYAVAPPATMQRWSQEALEGFRDWQRHGGRFLDDIIIPFGEVRDNIVNDPQQTVLRTLTQAQPECSGGEEPSGGENDLIPQCRPSEARLEGFYLRMEQRWREQPRRVWTQLMPDDIDRYPDDISLADFIEEESGEEAWEVRQSWRASRWGLRVAQWLLGAFIGAQCIVALGIVALLAARNWREAFRWVGTPILLVGAFTLLFGLLFFIGGEIGTWFIPNDEIPIGVEDVIEDSVRALSNEIWPSTMWQGGVLILIGVGIWVLSFFAPVGRQRILAPVSATPPTAPSASSGAPPPVETAAVDTGQEQAVEKESPTDEIEPGETAPPKDTTPAETEPPDAAPQ